MDNDAQMFEAHGDAVEVEAMFEAEPYAGASIVAVDDIETADPAEVETPLADADEQALEAGIASIFDTLLSEGFDADEEAAFAIEGTGAVDDEAEIEPTIALLAELDRLWAQPLAA